MPATSGLMLPPVKATLSLISAHRGVRAVRSGRRYPPWDRLTAPQLPEPRRGLDDHAEPAAADIPALNADVDSGELIAAQLPQLLVMHDPSDGSQIGPCSRKPPRRYQYLGRSQDAHHDSMGTCDGR
jgi:hypothetical protein